MSSFFTAGSLSQEKPGKIGYGVRMYLILFYVHQPVFGFQFPTCGSNNGSEERNGIYPVRSTLGSEEFLPLGTR